MCNIYIPCHSYEELAKRKFIVVPGVSYAGCVQSIACVSVCVEGDQQ